MKDAQVYKKEPKFTRTQQEQSKNIKRDEINIMNIMITILIWIIAF